MRAGGGKSKGSGFERLLCKQLSLWITHGEKEDVFWRSAMSGGRGTRLAAKGRDAQNSAGDITATGAEGHQLTDNFFIEAKFYRSLAIEAFLFKNSGTLWKFWNVCVAEAHKHTKAPLLIAKQNGLETFVVARSADILKQGYDPPPFLSLYEVNGDEVGLYWFSTLFPEPPRRKPKFFTSKKP